MTRVLNLVGDHVTSQLMQIYDEPVIHTEPDGEGYHVVLTNYALSKSPSGIGRYTCGNFLNISCQVVS